MVNKVIEDAKEFLLRVQKGKDNKIEVTHPWRKDWKFQAMHSFRVLGYVEDIFKEEKNELTENDKNIIRIAAILHDVGRTISYEEHAKKSAEMVEKWISEENISLEKSEKEKLLYLIKTHSEKDTDDNNYMAYILKDADTLDEIGAMSIFMASNWLDNTSPFFFHELSRKLKDRELKFCDKKMGIIRTNTGKKILKQKKQFIENFIMQLDSELQNFELQNYSESRKKE